jgi:hypothetical protein
MTDLIERWRRAAERAAEEKIRIVTIDGQYYATSASQPLGAYRLTRSPEGWRCECIANSDHGVPCKHLSALADVLDLDVLSDMYVEWPEAVGASSAA